MVSGHNAHLVSLREEMRSAKEKHMENGKKKKRPKRFPAEIQAMVDGGRMLYSIIVSIVAAVVEAGGNSEHIRRLDQPEGKSVICQIADLIVGKAALVAAVTQYSFDDLFDAFQQHDYGDTEFTESRWPLEPVALDENDWEVVEHRFAKNLTIKEGLRRLTKMADEGKIRLLAGSRRAMEWVAPHLDDGLIHPAILPLCAQDSDGKWVVPVFGLMWHDGSCQPGMTLYDLDEMTYPAHRWLVLRRIQPSPAR